MTLLDRLIDRSIPIPVTGCLIWLGSDSGNGYGKIRVKGKSKMAHRVMYEITVGPIPDGKILDHKCRCRLCIEPNHLEPVTHRVNTLRGEAVLFGPIDR